MPTLRGMFRILSVTCLLMFYYYYGWAECAWVAKYGMGHKKVSVSCVF